MRFPVNNLCLKLSVWFLFGSFSLLLPIGAQGISHTNKDKAQVEIILSDLPDEGYLKSPVIYLAEKFLNAPYKASTLELEGDERLVVNLREFDCTTYVETVLALYLTAKYAQKDNWDTFITFLQKIRYRTGELNGYESRLHYFSEWISDNEQKGFIKETSCVPFAQRLTLNLNYMTTHPESYPKLKDNSGAIRKMGEIEEQLQGKTVCFIPEKEIARLHSTDPIKEGDIIALTTNINGLDITHVGFAVRKNGKIHLLHASSRHKKVLVDPLPLDEYVRNGSRLTGIRILSIQ